MFQTLAFPLQWGNRITGGCEASRGAALGEEDHEWPYWRPRKPASRRVGGQRRETCTTGCKAQLRRSKLAARAVFLETFPVAFSHHLLLHPFPCNG